MFGYGIYLFSLLLASIERGLELALFILWLLIKKDLASYIC